MSEDATTQPVVLLDRAHLEQVLRHLADDILAQPWAQDLAEFPLLVGIREGGVVVAQELARIIGLSTGMTPRLGALDITFYRDDTWLKGPRMTQGHTDLPEDLTGVRILLVDDVLFTGRTVRAALNALVDFGRPKAVLLAVLLDRGGRELPIAADAVGHRLEVAADLKLEVQSDEHGHLKAVVQVASV